MMMTMKVIALLMITTVVMAYNLDMAAVFVDNFVFTVAVVVVAD